MLELPPPDGLLAEFAGDAKVINRDASRQGGLILAYLLTMYVALGVLYDSLLHPLTILLTLPSAGLGHCSPCITHLST